MTWFDGGLGQLGNQEESLTAWDGVYSRGSTLKSTKSRVRGDL